VANESTQTKIESRILLASASHDKNLANHPFSGVGYFDIRTLTANTILQLWGNDGHECSATQRYPTTTCHQDDDIFVMGLYVHSDRCDMSASPLWPLVLYFASIVALVIAILVLSSLLGERSPQRRATIEPFESGVVHIGSAQSPTSIEYFLVAMFFVIFDLETVFIFAWAVAFEPLGLFGYIAISVFILVLVVALVYEWRSGALDWGRKSRLQKTGLQPPTNSPINPPKGYALQPAQD
jgi:NADH-quinone oxidoreductase subunit A